MCTKSEAENLAAVGITRGVGLFSPDGTNTSQILNLDDVLTEYLNSNPPSL